MPDTLHHSPSGSRLLPPLRFRLDPGLLMLLALASVFLPVLFLLYPQYALLLIGALAGAALLMVSIQMPVLPIALLLVAAPFNIGKQFGPMNIKVTEVLTGLMFAVLFVRLLLHDPLLIARARRSMPIALLLALLAVGAIATALPHENRYNVRYELTYYVALIYAVLCFEKAMWRPLIIVAAFTLAAESVLALIFRFHYDISGVNFFVKGTTFESYEAELEEVFAGGRFRLRGTMGHKNLLAAYILLLLPMVALMVLRRPRPLGVLAAIASVVALALTDSMTGWGAGVLVLVLALLFLRRFDYLAGVLLFALPAAAVVLIRFGESVFFRATQLFGSHEGWGTVSSRQEILGITLRLIHDHFWFGIGRLNFMEAGDTYFTHSHNMFLAKMVEMGLPLGMIFTLAVVAALWMTLRPLLMQGRQLAAEGDYFPYLGAWLGCLSFTAMNCFDYGYASFSLGPLYGLLFGMLIARVYQLNDTEREPFTAG